MDSASRAPACSACELHHQPRRPARRASPTRTRAPRRGSRRTAASSTPPARRGRAGPGRWRSSPTATPRAPPRRRRCRTAPASAARRARRRPAPARVPACAGHDVGEQLEPTPHVGVAAAAVPAGRRRPGRRPPAHAAGRSPAAARAATPRPALSRRPPAPRDTRSAPASTGSGSPVSGKLQRAAVEHRGRPGGPQRRLGRRRRPAAQVGAVPMRPCRAPRGPRRRPPRRREGRPAARADRRDSVTAAHASPPPLPLGPSSTTFVARHPPPAALAVSCQRRCNVG